MENVQQLEILLATLQCLEQIAQAKAEASQANLQLSREIFDNVLYAIETYNNRVARGLNVITSEAYYSAESQMTNTLINLHAPIPGINSQPNNEIALEIAVRNIKAHQYEMCLEQRRILSPHHTYNDESIARYAAAEFQAERDRLLSERYKTDIANRYNLRAMREDVQNRLG